MTLEEKEAYLVSQIGNEKNFIEFVMLETTKVVKEIHILSEDKKLLIVIENYFISLEEALDFVGEIKESRLLYGKPYKIIY